MKAHYVGCQLDDKCTCQEIDDMDEIDEREDDCKPNNRPQDGRICNCEDVPCCGHYEL